MSTKEMDSSLKAAFRLFARNERWGTCVACPRDSDGNFYPEFCVNTGRYDHHLTLKNLAADYAADKAQRSRKEPAL